MRLLSGLYHGREIERPKSSLVRPLSQKTRAALFDVVGSVEGAMVLDAYAGSGAAGFEALSRGAAMVEAIEANRSAAAVIKRNVQSLELTWGYVLHQMTVETWLALPGNQAPQRQRYDLIIADPPYAKLDPEVLVRLGGYLADHGILVVSHGSKLAPPVLSSLSLAQSKFYGDSALSFYRQ